MVYHNKILPEVTSKVIFESYEFGSKDEASKQDSQFMA